MLVACSSCVEIDKDPLCYDKCPLYSKEDLNISVVSCTTSHSVMEFDLYKLDNYSLDTSQLSVSVIMQVVTFPHISTFYTFENISPPKIPPIYDFVDLL